MREILPDDLHIQPLGQVVFVHEGDADRVLAAADHAQVVFIERVRAVEDRQHELRPRKLPDREVHPRAAVSTGSSVPRMPAVSDRRSTISPKRIVSLTMSRVVPQSR